MAQLRGRLIGSSVAGCRGCGQRALQTVHETRYVREWTELLARRFDPAISRTSTCQACGLTYPIRATDRTGEAAARRGTGAHTAGRDWSYRL